MNFKGWHKFLQTPEGLSYPSGSEENLPAPTNIRVRTFGPDVHQGTTRKRLRPVIEPAEIVIETALSTKSPIGAGNIVSPGFNPMVKKPTQQQADPPPPKKRQPAVKMTVGSTRVILNPVLPGEGSPQKHAAQNLNCRPAFELPPALAGG